MGRHLAQFALPHHHIGEFRRIDQISIAGFDLTALEFESRRQHAVFGVPGVLADNQVVEPLMTLQRSIDLPHQAVESVAHWRRVIRSLAHYDKGDRLFSLPLPMTQACSIPGSAISMISIGTGGHVLALGGLELFFDPADDPEDTIELRAQVAGMKPVIGKRLGGCLRIEIVFAENSIAANQDLAVLGQLHFDTIDRTTDAAKILGSKREITAG